MEYNFLTISDIHWGVMEPKLQELRYQYILEVLDSDLELDFIVINGDFWDCKLPLNSEQSRTGIHFMKQMKQKIMKRNIKMFVMKGTQDHDNEQLEVFRDDEDKYFQIINKTTSIQIFDDLRAIFCPDETISNEEYYDRYTNEMMSGNQIGFFHGSFDVVYTEIGLGSGSNINNVCYEYDLWNKIINGPLIAGHWHDGKEYNNLIYTGSPDVWKFNEDEPKGILYTSYDTDTCEYFHYKIENPLSPLYLTYEIYTNVYIHVDQYRALFDEIHNILDKYENDVKDVFIRIKFFVVTDNVETEKNIEMVKLHFIDDKRVKISIKNKLKAKKKKEEFERTRELNTNYGFINDNNVSEANKFHEFILKQYDVDIPIEIIEEKINKYKKG